MSANPCPLDAFNAEVHAGIITNGYRFSALMFCSQIAKNIECRLTSSRGPTRKLNYFWSLLLSIKQRRQHLVSTENLFGQNMKIFSANSWKHIRAKKTSHSHMLAMISQKKELPVGLNTLNRSIERLCRQWSKKRWRSSSGDVLSTGLRHLEW